jgi:hypothetical protein
MDLEIFIENSEERQPSPILPLFQHLTVLEEDLEFFLDKAWLLLGDLPELKLGYTQDPLVSKLNYMSDHVVKLFEYRTLEVRIFKIPVAISAYLIIEDAREARNAICHLRRILKNPVIGLEEREKLARLQHLVRCEFRHMTATEGKNKNC